MFPGKLMVLLCWEVKRLWAYKIWAIYKASQMRWEDFWHLHAPSQTEAGNLVQGRQNFCDLSWSLSSLYPILLPLKQGIAFLCCKEELCKLTSVLNTQMPQKDLQSCQSTGWIWTVRLWLGCCPHVIYFGGHEWVVACLLQILVIYKMDKYLEISTKLICKARV